MRLQPHIIAPEGQVMFWYGIPAPTREIMA